MGCCISSAGAYPGNRRVAKPAYAPSDDEYKQVDKNTAVANAHFVTCPGGNALKLVGKPNRAEGDVGGGKGGSSEGLAQYISVTLPDGVQSGDIIHVRAPDGRMNAISVPEGMGPGSTFTVEFATDASYPPPKEEDLTPGVYVPTVMAMPEVETGVYSAAFAGGGMETATAVGQPTTAPYVSANATKY